MDVFLINNNQCELCDDTTSRPRCQSCLITYCNLERPNYVDPLFNGKKELRNYLKIMSLTTEYLVYGDLSYYELIPVSILNTTPKIY